MAAVKSLAVCHHSAGLSYFIWDNLANPGYFENRLPLKPALGTNAASQTTVLLMKRLNQTESPIIVILCVLPKRLTDHKGLQNINYTILKYGETFVAATKHLHQLQ